VTIRFGPFDLSLASRQLMRDGREVHLTPKAFDLLALLIEARPRLLTKPVLQEQLWPNTFVAEANLSNLIAEVRAALGDRARTPLYIRTAHAVGYAFCGAVAAGHPVDVPARDVRCWLEWDGRRFDLSSGTHMIGRDAEVGIRLDRSSVSRRHARLVITADAVVLEDCGSKNGTFVRAGRVTAPTTLVDGDEIRVGSLLVTFHLHAPCESTVTLPSTPVH
jgi:DNA-binding winged helix-turn-helix (wHTH) protein